MIESEDGNIMYTCSDCGKDTYKMIKSTENQYDNMAYVWFKDEVNGDEKMWVKITNGNVFKGSGRLRNRPVKIKMKFNDKVKFKTDEEGITYGYK